MRRDITAAIRRFRPDRVLTNSPLRRWERIAGPSHPDHLAVGEATTCAIYPDARNPFAFPELLRGRVCEPWVVREVWYRAAPTPTTPSTSPTAFESKLAALRAHESQIAHMRPGQRVLRGRGMAPQSAQRPAAAGGPAGRGVHRPADRVT